MNSKKMTYKEAVAEIDEILAKIEQEELDVDELSEKVRRVSLLIRFCKEKLHKTSEEVENILREMEE
ncbi:MAG: exodeoxyribonuclease VII small subunit [Prolixibacteraceae bacterium]|jgi:exodeoxyribonuclease VII small subunit